MLQSLHIKNLALIDEMEVEFEPGLNILTGETGAGKSLIIGSINMALGQKVTKDMLADKAKDALVELVFGQLDGQTVEKLMAMDIIPEDGQVIMSRKITGSRSVARINGESMPASRAKEAAQLLIDIHGQHEHQSLIKKKVQLGLLDNYAGDEATKAREKVQASYATYQALKKELETTDIDLQQRERELSFLEFEIEEIQNANLQEKEDEALEAAYQKMLNAKRIAEACSVAHQMTSVGPQSATEQVGRALKELSQVTSFDGGLSSLEEQLAQIDGLLNDFNREMADYLEALEFGQEEFQKTELRLDEINRLKAKYGASIPAILKAKEEKEKRAGELRHFDEHMAKLRSDFEQAKAQLEAECASLSAIRQRFAKRLSEEVREHLLDLNFSSVQLTMRFERLGHYTADGYDEVGFLISTNPGEEMKPLEKVASGGELSRIMLALKTVLAQGDEIGTLIFDEIDTGISGRTAQKVSEKMNLIGKSHQVICITHLPQIAAMADTHFLIEKQVEDGKTRSAIRKLEGPESVQELARMLGGVSITDAVVENAREMKELAAQSKAKEQG